MELDRTDLKILDTLQNDGRLTNVELSERVALSPSPCLRRLKQMEDAGIIERYAALLSADAIGLGLQAYIRVSIRKDKHHLEAFEEAVLGWDEVLQCLALTGEADYLLLAYFADMADFSHFILNTLLALPSVEDATSSFVLKKIKHTTALPLKHLAISQNRTNNVTDE